MHFLYLNLFYGRFYRFYRSRDNFYIEVYKFDLFWNSELSAFTQFHYDNLSVSALKKLKGKC